jgi:hypothetical protein
MSNMVGDRRKTFHAVLPNPGLRDTGLVNDRFSVSSERTLRKMLAFRLHTHQRNATATATHPFFLCSSENYKFSLLHPLFLR